MKPYLVRTPGVVQRLYPKRVWSFPGSKKAVFLTFDDGPIPEVTPWVLDQLHTVGAKATFFCIGDNVRKHPDIFRRIIAEGHAIGNHTFHHLKGNKTSTSRYLENVRQAEELMQAIKEGAPSEGRSTSLFRPPYGKLTAVQSKRLREEGYTIVMWDVLSADFDTSVSEKKCLKNVVGALQPGSILVFHDSIKAAKNMKYALPEVLQYISEKGWKCEAMEG
ncbi:MAG: polysaccharide deacetylase family protein [Bacteroidota bacterium]